MYAPCFLSVLKRKSLKSVPFLFMVSHFFVNVNEQKVNSVDTCINELHSKEKLPYIGSFHNSYFFFINSSIDIISSFVVETYA